jgi:hypothetical protein
MYSANRAFNLAFSNAASSVLATVVKCSTLHSALAALLNLPHLVELFAVRSTCYWLLD